MRKLYAILFLLLILVIKTNGQGTDNPILPRIYEDGYSIPQIEEFALMVTEFSNNYRKKMLSIINKALRSSGEYVNVNGGQPLTDNHISWIYDHVQREPNGYLPAGYSNTYRNGNSVASSKGKTDYYGPIDRFIFGSCIVNLDKPSCVNLLGDLGIFEPPNRGGQIVQQQPPVEQRSKEQITSQATEQSSTAFVAPKTAMDMALSRVPEEEQSNDIFLPKNKFNWKPVIIVGGVAVVAGTGILLYSLLNKKGKPQDAPPVGGSPQDGQPVGGP